MCFNNSIFQLIQYGTNSELRTNYNYHSPDYSPVINPSEEVRDLVIQVNNSGTYSNHVDYVYNKTKQRVNILLRTLNNCSMEFMKYSWKTYGQPILDYVS